MRVKRRGKESKFFFRKGRKSKRLMKVPVISRSTKLSIWELTPPDFIFNRESFEVLLTPSESIRRSLGPTEVKYWSDGDSGPLGEVSRPFCPYLTCKFVPLKIPGPDVHLVYGRQYGVIGRESLYRCTLTFPLTRYLRLTPSFSSFYPNHLSIEQRRWLTSNKVVVYMY